MKINKDINSNFLVCTKCQKTISTEKVSLNCPRCNSYVEKRNLKRQGECLIYLLTAGICFIPANLFDIMIIDKIIDSYANTIAGGIIDFFKNGYYFIGAIILFASIMIPLIKIFGLFFLLFHQKNTEKWVKRKTKIYHFIEMIGKWSMIDIFVICIFTGLIDLGFFIKIKSGPGAVFFTIVVILTMLASKKFEPRFMWDKAELNHE